MKNVFDLSNKVALITGASSGMGKAIAETLGKHGATVLISSNDAAGCAKVTAVFRSENITAFSIPCDVTQNKELDKLIDKAQDYAGRIDILVSCVGMAMVGSF